MIMANHKGTLDYVHKISIIFAIVTNLLQHFFEIRLLTRNTIELLASGLCAGYWIYMSEKLRDVLRKWLRI